MNMLKRNLMKLSCNAYLALTIIIAFGICGAKADAPATAPTAAPAVSDKDRKAIETVRKLVAAKGNLDAVVDEKVGDTPLIIAIRLDQVDLVKNAPAEWRGGERCAQRRVYAADDRMLLR